LRFSTGYWNIGAEGQLYAGAIAGAWLGIVLKGVSPVIGIPLMILGGFTAGLLWALPPALLKVRLHVDEVVTTLLLNSVIVFLVSYVLNGPWRDPVSMWPQSPEIAAGTVFFKLIPRSRLHFGFLVALVVIAAEWFILTRSSLGLRMRAVGLGKDAARFAGINVNRTVLIAALVSGGIAGLAGVGEVAGIHFHLIDSISDGLGYSGVIIATLGGLNPLGVGLAGLFGFDLFMLADAMLYGHLDPDIWVARGVANLLVIPFVAISTARNPAWTIEMHVSRGADHGGSPRP
jgi:simple sugar transport system permease protein